MANIDWESTQAAINQFKPQELYMGWKKEEVKPTFLSDLVLNLPSKFHNTVEFQYDIKNEKTSVPVYCTPRSSTNLVKFGGFERVKAAVPYINEGFEITMDEIQEVLEGYDPYEWNKLGVAERLVLITNDKSRQMRKRLNNIHEVQVAQQLQTGKVPILGDDVDLEIDIRLPATHLITLTGDDRWSEAGSDGTKINQITTVWELIRDSDGGIATDMVMSGRVAGYLLEDTEYDARMNKRHTNVGTFDPQLLDNGGYVSYMGELVLNNGAMIKQWMYDDKYRSNDGQTETRYIGQNNYILLNANRIPGRRHYGLINNINAAQAGLANSDVYTYMKVDPDGKYVRQVFETAPITLIEDATRFATVTVTDAV